MRKFFLFCCFVFSFVFAGCDLQPKIASIPDSVGDFISERYPTLLAEPDSEIYKTAVADYGIYVSPGDYGNGDLGVDDYVLYSPADDYTMPAQDTEIEEADVGMPDEKDVDTEIEKNEENTGYAPDTDVDDLRIPDYVNEKPVISDTPRTESGVATETKVKTDVKSVARPNNQEQKKQDVVRAPVREIVVAKGDTLYSLSRKYSVPVNDLAVMNKISAPFALSVGQKLKVVDVLSVPKYDPDVQVVRSAATVNTDKPQAVQKKTDQKNTDVAQKTNVKAPAVALTPKVATKTPAAKTTVKPEVKKSTNVQKTASKQNTNVNAKKDVKTQTKKAEQTKKTAKTENKKTQTKKTESKQTVQKTGNKKTNTKQLAARSSSKFSWPVRGKILSGYGSKTNGLFNDGINIKAARGTTVTAAENGFVAYAGNEVKGMGNLVIIQHSDGWMTVYAHMDSMSVKRGYSVGVGQKIGTVGTSGKVDQPQLHFEIRKGTKAYNPVNYLKK